MNNNIKFETEILLGKKIIKLLDLSNSNNEYDKFLAITKLASEIEFHMPTLMFYMYYNYYNFNPPKELIDKLNDRFKESGESFDEFIREDYEQDVLVIYSFVDATYRGLLWERADTTKNKIYKDICNKLGIPTTSKEIYITNYDDIFAIIKEEHKLLVLIMNPTEKPLDFIYKQEFTDDKSTFKISNIINTIRNSENLSSLYRINYVLSRFFPRTTFTTEQNIYAQINKI